MNFFRKLSASVADTASSPAQPVAPTVFARTLSAPPGLPWDQARMAGLDARAGAPLPLAELVYQLKRLDPWRPGRPARYLVCYVRAGEVGDRLAASTMVDGAPVAVEFVSAAERSRRARQIGIVAAVVAATGALVVGAVASALTTGALAADQLTSLDQAVAVRAHQASELQALKIQTRVLNQEHLRGQAIGDFLADLAWVSRSRAPDAHIDALHWDHGYMGLETRGSAPPFGQTGRSVVKADKPLRPNVWLWGIGPATAQPLAAKASDRPAPVPPAPSGPVVGGP